MPTKGYRIGWNFSTFKIAGIASACFLLAMVVSLCAQSANQDSALIAAARRASAGDAEAEKTVLKRLSSVIEETDEAERKSGDFLELIEAGSATLVAGTPGASAAFAEALSSPKVYSLPRRREAVAFLLLRIWWTARPNAGAIRDEFYELFSGCQDAEVFKAPNYLDYLKRLEGYFLEKHGMAVRFTAPFFIDGCPWD